MIGIIDPGHKFMLLSLDGESDKRVLQFVKRFDKNNPGGGKFPGNYEAYPGATLQSVIRALLSRFYYLQGQIWSVGNAVVIRLFRLCLWLLAARRHGHFYFHGPKFAENAAMCSICGHTQCEHKSHD